MEIGMDNNEEVNEVWSLARRRKQGQMLRRKSKVISKARARKMKRRADPLTLKKRAQKAARALVFKKSAQGKTKGEIESKQQIMAIEKRLEKHKGKIDKIAKKILPIIKRKEAERFKSMIDKKGQIDPTQKAG